MSSAGGDSEAVSYRLYQPGDEAGIVELLHASFDGWPRVECAASPQDHLLWKLSSAPESTRFQVVAEAGSKIVGCRLFFLTWFRIQRQRLSCRQGFDLAVHPDYRGQGILNGMWAVARKRFDVENDFNFGVGDHPAALHMRIAQGNIKIENKVQVLVHPLSVAPTAARPTGFEVRTVTSFDGRADDLFEDAARQFDFIRERATAFLNWRHADSRSGNFVIMQAEADGALLGYIVLSSAGSSGILADVLARPDRLDVVEGLVQQAIRYFAARGMSRIECWVPTEHIYRRVLVQNGFTHKKRVIRISYRYLRAPPSQFEFLSDPRASVHIMANDTDLV